MQPFQCLRLLVLVLVVTAANATGRRRKDPILVDCTPADQDKYGKPPYTGIACCAGLVEVSEDRPLDRPAAERLAYPKMQMCRKKASATKKASVQKKKTATKTATKKASATQKASVQKETTISSPPQNDAECAQQYSAGAWPDFTCPHGFTVGGALMNHKFIAEASSCSTFQHVICHCGGSSSACDLATCAIAKVVRHREGKVGGGLLLEAIPKTGGIAATSRFRSSLHSGAPTPAARAAYI